MTSPFEDFALGNDPTTTEFDGTVIRGAVRNALSVRGAKDAPDRMDITKLYAIVDVLQSGYARATSFQEIGFRSMPAGLTVQEFQIIGPDNTLNVDTRRDSINKETRLDNLEFKIDYPSSPTESIWDLDLILRDPANSGPNSPQSVFHVRYVEGDPPLDPFRVNTNADYIQFSEDSDSETGFITICGHSWKGRIPPGWLLFARFERASNIPVNTGIHVNATLTQVPAGVQLPQ